MKSWYLVKLECNRTEQYTLLHINKETVWQSGSCFLYAFLARLAFLTRLR